MTIQPLLPENKEIHWKYEYEQITARVDVAICQTITLIPETPIQWFTTIMPSQEIQKEKKKNIEMLK